MERHRKTLHDMVPDEMPAVSEISRGRYTLGVQVVEDQGQCGGHCPNHLPATRRINIDGIWCYLCNACASDLARELLKLNQQEGASNAQARHHD